MAEFIADNEDEWEIQEANSEWLQEFCEFLGPEFWFYKQQAIIEASIEELIGGEK